MIRYNLKIIFAGKFIWFLLAAFAFFLFFAIQTVWNRGGLTEGTVYNLLDFPGNSAHFLPFGFWYPKRRRFANARNSFRYSQLPLQSMAGKATYDLCAYFSDDCVVFCCCFGASLPGRCVGNVVPANVPHCFYGFDGFYVFHGN
jgi:hypothetical protein